MMGYTGRRVERLMMSALPQDKHFMSPEEYLAFERESEEKHEYLDGEIFAMTGASERHILIVGSTHFSLYGQLDKRPCKVYMSDMRVRVKGTSFYTYPDISLVCGDAEFEDDDIDTLLNPMVIIEVLSPSTESYNRGKKFQRYRELESLQEYVLIAQDSRRIEHFLRQGEKWILTDARGADAVVTLPSIECTLALGDVYAKVAF
jgi:Uma2 family endonuclease